MPRRLYQVPRFEDRWSHLYLEHCRVDQDEDGLCAHDKDGVTRIPIDQVALLMLGPGTSVTHAAMKVMAADSCMVSWVGEQGVRLYAHSTGATFSSHRLEVQARLVSDERARNGVARRMYQHRFEEEVSSDVSMDQLRGMEGIRVRRSYSELAKEYGVEWKGRVYDQDSWSSGDPLNRALSVANACLYGICHAAIVSIGLSPALGFVHRGKMLSFVYDVADFYKTEITVPLAFKSCSAPLGGLETEVRRAIRDMMHEKDLINRILPDIEEVFDVAGFLRESPTEFEGRAVSLAPGTEDGGVHGKHDGEGS